jgi:hypothetical protein
MTLTWWELEELQEHLQSRPDIWTWDEMSQFWTRSDTEGAMLCALRFRGPNNLGPYRQFQVQQIEFGWTVDETSQYLLELCTKWTSYGYRMEIAKLLIEDDAVKMDPATAMAMSVGIVKLEMDPKTDPDKEGVAPAHERLPDFGSGFFDAGQNDPRYFVVGLFGGGYVRISQRSEMLYVTLSIPSNGGFSGDGQLSGFVRPKNGNFEGACRVLFGQTDVPEGDPKPKVAQIILPGEEGYVDDRR